MMMTGPGRGHVLQSHPLTALVMSGLVGRNVGRMGTCSRTLEEIDSWVPFLFLTGVIFLITFHGVNENVESCPFGWAIDIH